MAPPSLEPLLELARAGYGVTKQMYGAVPSPCVLLASHYRTYPKYRLQDAGYNRTMPKLIATQLDTIVSGMLQCVRVHGMVLF